MPIKKKLLIVSMKGGFGHLRAGSALLDYAKLNFKDVDVEHIDIINVSLFFNFLSKFYEVLVPKAPFMWGIIYKFLDNRITSFLIKILGYFNFIFGYRIRDYIKKIDPDIILITNIVCTPAVLSACKNVATDKKIFSLITDYHGHYYYKFSRIDSYFVPHSKVKDDLIKTGINSEKIIITGMPIDPKFYIEHDIKELKSKHKINNNYRTVLFLASFKISKKDLICVIEDILKSEPKVNLIFVANGNQKKYNLVKNIRSDRFFPVNWTNEMEEYMKISDIVVTKPGGLTISECMFLKKPMILFNPISGQEKYNAKFIEDNKFGIRAKNTNEIIMLISEYIFNPENNAYKNSFFQDNSLHKIFNNIFM